jgi:hypothetical protein
MFDLLFDLPLAISGPTIVLALCFFGVGGLVFVRRGVLPRLRIRPEDSEFIGAMVQAVLVFYGLAVALIAVSVWQTYSDVSKIVSQEATALAALYRDVSGYPEPVRGQLQKELREYVSYVIHQAWPLQQRGRVPAGGVEHMNRFQAILVACDPATEGQKLLHAETLRAYNHMMLSRRMRLDAVNTGLPSVLWMVVAAGAAISLSASFFFKVEDIRLHGTLVVLLATFIGLVIFMTFALDRPFRSDLGVGPDPYQLIYDQLMKSSPAIQPESPLTKSEPSNASPR